MLLVIPWFTGNPAGLSVIEAWSDCGSMDPLTLRSEEVIAPYGNLSLSLGDLRQISAKHICGKIWSRAQSLVFNWPFKTPANVFKAGEIVLVILLVFRQGMKQLVPTTSLCLVRIDVFW